MDTITLPLWIFIGGLVLGTLVVLALVGAAIAVWQSGAQLDDAVRRIEALEERKQT